MKAKVIQLPKSVTAERMFSFLQLLGSADGENKICLDFKMVQFYEPIAIVLLLSRLRHWHNHGVKLSMSNYKTCPAHGYLQRIDFYEQLGLKLEESFLRQASAERFVEICTVKKTNADEIAREMSRCIAVHSEQADDVETCFKYALGEILANCAQHSGAEGYACAQYYPKSKRIAIAVADCGIGLRNSFNDTEMEGRLLSHEDALRECLKPFVSSALLRPPPPYGSHVNRGIGLAMVSELARQTCGVLHVGTYDAHLERLGNNAENYTTEVKAIHPGTFTSLSINGDELVNSSLILKEVESEVMSQEISPDITNDLDDFDNMFDNDII